MNKPDTDADDMPDVIYPHPELAKKLAIPVTLNPHYISEQSHLAAISELNAKHKEELDNQQFQIDSLMMEYCPDEMTEEQILEWARHQIRTGGR